MQRLQRGLALEEEPQDFPAEENHFQEITQMQKSLLEHYQGSQQASSTYLIASAQLDINLREVYVLNKHILQDTKLTSNIRARIRSFVMDQCAKQWISRETSALACTYIDLYFLKKGYCQIQEVQTMAISCLMLARKQQEGKPPTVSFHIFSKESLLQWEKKVAKKLQYRLLPPTYITFAEHVAKKWELFTSKQVIFTKHFGVCEAGINVVLRMFYQQLDCLFLVLQTLKWDLELVVINLFYLHSYALNVPQRFVPHHLSEQEFVRSLYAQKDEFFIFFQKFLKYYSKNKSFKLTAQLGAYLRRFKALKGTKKEFTILNSQSKFNSLRVWDKLQTYSKESYDLAKNVMEKIRRT